MGWPQCETLWSEKWQAERCSCGQCEAGVLQPGPPNSCAGNTGGHGLCTVHSKNPQMLTMQTKDSQQPQVTAEPWLLLTGRIPLQNYNRGNKDFSHFPSPYMDTPFLYL